MKIFITTFIFIQLILSSITLPQNKKSKIFDHPHERDETIWLSKFPHSLTPLKVPQHNPDFITDFLNIDISKNLFPQNEPSVKISRVNPYRVITAWRDFRTGVNPPLRRVGYSLSSDGGETWSNSKLLPQIIPNAALSSDPVVGVDLSGNFYIFTISINDDTGNGELWVFKSTDQGETFDQVYQMANDLSAFEDKEWATTDLNASSPYANNLYCSWTRFSSGTEILLVRSTDEGINWSSPVSVSDLSNVQGSFPAVGPNGELYVTWLGFNNTRQIMFDKSTDGGVTFGTDVVISDAINSWFPHMAVDLSNGPRKGYIYVTWGDERNGDDDAFLSYSSDGGETWSSVIRVNNDPVGNGKLQYWPSVAVSELGEISIIFYDTRNTANNNFIETYLARSTDALTFTNELMSTEPSPTSIPNNDVRFGDYIGIDSYGGVVVPIWTDERAGGFDMDIYTAKINPLLPVELKTFTARIVDGNTILEWSTATETNNFGFEIQRSYNNGENGGGWFTAGFVEGQGTTTSIHNYTFTDKGLGKTVYYRLKQIDYNGAYRYSEVLKVNSVSIKTIALEQNYPNPFNPSTKIRYQVANDGFVNLKVFNSMGEEVVALVNSYQLAGSYEVKFDGSDFAGGVYFYSLSAGSFSEMKKFVLLK
ncbi:T9SS type A sorting domain-containing protein [bacterium BMS3Abin03]|nr:T9SS type A sorting domain-containing protein [bacterium BMS3Abin03]